MIVLESVYEGFNSSAIKSVTIKDNQCIIIFNSQDKEYNYVINDNNFEKELQSVINTNESVGKYINSAIKGKKIEQLNTIVQ